MEQTKSYEEIMYKTQIELVRLIIRQKNGWIKFMKKLR